MALSKYKLTSLLLIVTLIASTILLFADPILQNSAYHQFADQRTFLSIPNFCNVISNLAFLWVGFIGLLQLYKQQLNIIIQVRYSYAIFFTAVAFIAIGSAYYHWQPNNLTLVWDRLPMTVVFMSLLSFAFAEYLSVRLGRFSLLPLLLIGVLSIVYWFWGEQRGAGDLRLYVLIQFLPTLLLLLLFLFGKTNFKNQSGYWWLFSAYVLAKFAEHFDVLILKITRGIISGHTIKHLLSAAGLYILLFSFKKR